MGETITLQRRSTKLTVSLANHPNYDALEKHVRDSFKLEDKVNKQPRLIQIM